MLFNVRLYLGRPGHRYTFYYLCFKFFKIVEEATLTNIKMGM